jgi:hypothetical protein
MGIMADLAAVFHWQPSEMANLHFDELSAWHKMAMERSSRE